MHFSKMQSFSIQTWEKSQYQGPGGWKSFGVTQVSSGTEKRWCSIGVLILWSLPGVSGRVELPGAIRIG